MSSKSIKNLTHEEFVNASPYNRLYAIQCVEKANILNNDNIKASVLVDSLSESVFNDVKSILGSEKYLCIYFKVPEKHKKYIQRPELAIGVCNKCTDDDVLWTWCRDNLQALDGNDSPLWIRSDYIWGIVSNNLVWTPGFPDKSVCGYTLLWTCLMIIKSGSWLGGRYELHNP